MVKYTRRYGWMNTSKIKDHCSWTLFNMLLDKVEWTQVKKHDHCSGTCLILHEDTDEWTQAKYIYKKIQVNEQKQKYFKRHM